MFFCSSPRLTDAGVCGDKEGCGPYEGVPDYPVTSIHGDRSQRDRWGHTPILVVTRGLNIPHIINGGGCKVLLSNCPNAIKHRHRCVN
jgi:hypothetical protein